MAPMTQPQNPEPNLPDFSRALQDPRLMEAALALHDNRLHDAEPLLKAHLKADPFDVAAIRMLAELAGRIGRYPDAENLLRRALDLSPGFTAARSNLATLLYRQGKSGEAIAELNHLAEQDPDHLGNANLKAAAHGRIGDYDEAIALYEVILAAQPVQDKIWMSYGHVLKTVGRADDSIAAYRRAVAIRPGFGEVWWSLANLKTFKFSDDDLAIMQAQLARADLGDEDRFHIDFALGKACEDRRDWAASFAHYNAGNALRRAALDYDGALITAQVARSKALLTKDFFAARAGEGCPAPDPIFILGMPRAGSTLIEQILASHPLIEGTQELPDISFLAERVMGRTRDDLGGDLAGNLAALSLEERCALGAEYLERTRIHRKTDRPFFVDKMPNNWRYIGLILLILPNAKIIDARRHPMDCGFSNFKQHYARGQGFAYDLQDIGHYYADYVAMMQAVDVALPGRVLRVIHEAIVAQSETEIRSLISYLGLPFDEACLRFWENDRAVQTPSAEQVRRPINRDGMDRWRHYEQWLGPLKTALGPVLDSYPAPPVVNLP
jgi:tetratricopeptide (TPR) repeat protein